MFGKMSVGVLSTARPPKMRISIVTTTKVRGRLSATRTIAFMGALPFGCASFVSRRVLLSGPNPAERCQDGLLGITDVMFQLKHSPLTVFQLKLPRQLIPSRSVIFVAARSSPETCCFTNQSHERRQ